jgi:MFS family permease
VAFIRSLLHRGYRWSGWIGTVILAASCLGSSFVQTLEWMFFTHSLLYGVGSSLIYMASSLVIGEYFDKDHKYHVLATSILLCGYPIGL